MTAESPGRVASIRFTEGDRADAGDALVFLERREERASLDRARARLRQAERQLARLRALEADSLVSTEELDQARTAVEEAEAATAIAEEALADRRIEAPFAGVLGQRLVSPGALVGAGDAIVELTRTDPLDLTFEVPAEHLADVREGMRITAATRAYADETFAGTVSFVATTVADATRTLAVEATVDNGDGRLKPGQFMTVELILGERDALTVPEAAVVTRGPVTYVFAVDGEGVARRQVVQTGVRRDGWVEITDGLVADQRVVRAGTQAVRSGQSVRTDGAAAGAETGGPSR